MQNNLRITLPEVNWKKIKKTAIKSGIGAGLIAAGIVSASIYFQNYKWTYQSPITINLQTPLKIEKIDPQILLSPIPEVAPEAEAKEPEPTPTPEPISTAPKPVGEHQTMVYNLIGEIWGEEADLGRRMAHCESTYGANVENTVSSARGVFQFLKGTWTEQRNYQGDDPSLALRFDERENIQTAYNHYKRMGTSPWKASEHCWRK